MIKHVQIGTKDLLRKFIECVLRFHKRLFRQVRLKYSVLKMRGRNFNDRIQRQDDDSIITGALTSPGARILLPERARSKSPPSSVFFSSQALSKEDETRNKYPDGAPPPVSGQGAKEIVHGFPIHLGPDRSNHTTYCRPLFTRTEISTRRFSALPSPSLFVAAG